MPVGHPGAVWLREDPALQSVTTCAERPSRDPRRLMHGRARRGQLISRSSRMTIMYSEFKSPLRHVPFPHAKIQYRLGLGRSGGWDRSSLKADVAAAPALPSAPRSAAGPGGGCWPCCASRPARTGSGSAAGLGARNVTGSNMADLRRPGCFPAMGSRRGLFRVVDRRKGRRAGSLTHPETNSVYADARPRSETEVDMAELVSLHHARGLRPGVVAFADELCRAGHAALRTR